MFHQSACFCPISSPKSNAPKAERTAIATARNLGPMKSVCRDWRGICLAANTSAKRLRLLPEQKTSVQHWTIPLHKRLITAFRESTQSWNHVNYRYTEADRTQNGRAIIHGSTGTVQFLFISSDICHQGSIQNLWVQGAAKQQSQKATTWITAFIPKHECQGGCGCQGCADVLRHGKSASTRKPRSPEGAPSGRAGASARSRIWQGNCQITKD